MHAVPNFVEISLSALSGSEPSQRALVLLLGDHGTVARHHSSVDGYAQRIRVASPEMGPKGDIRWCDLF